MPAHPLADFFDTFYVFVKPVYASLTWPGTSLMFVPSVWLGLPPWVTPLVIASVVAGLLYSVITQICDGLCGLIAVVALAAIPLFRVHALSAQAQAPILLLAVLFVWAWLRWRRKPSPWRAAVVGAVAGWAAITRPVDAICIVLPVALATLPLLRQLSLRVTLTHAAVAVACAAPFIALQLVFNVGVTGSLMHTPFSYYNDRDQPQVAFGFPKYDPAARPQSQLLQKRVMYDEWYVPRIKTHTWQAAPARLASDAATTMNLLLPHRLLWVLVPPALLGIFSWERFAAWGVLPAFLVLYGFYTLFLDHYTLVAAPAVLAIVLGGMRAVQRCWPSVGGAVAVAALTLCVGSLPQFRAHELDEIPAPTMEYVANLPKFVNAPAIVLFHFEHGAAVHEEPVYNIDVAWPDDAPIIRAHDLGPEKNLELFGYYALHQPQRRVYTFDRAARQHPLRYLGTAAEVWDAARRAATTRAATKIFGVSNAPR
jgi:hypothetical protein